MSEPSTRSTDVHGLIDTNIVVLRRWIDAAELPSTMAISAITLAELSAGPHHTADGAERARRIELLQRTEAEFDPLPFDADGARAYGRVSAAVLAAGRTTRRRVADLMIASVAIANRMPLYTTNPDDFTGLEQLVRISAVTRPTNPRRSPPHSAAVSQRQPAAGYSSIL